MPRSTMRVPQPDIIEHFGNVDAVPQPPERCLSRKAGIMRCCLNCNTVVNQSVKLPRCVLCPQLLNQPNRTADEDHRKDDEGGGCVFLKFETCRTSVTSEMMPRIKSVTLKGLINARRSRQSIVSSFRPAKLFAPYFSRIASTCSADKPSGDAPMSL